MDLRVFKEQRVLIIGIIISFVLFFSHQLKIPYLDSATESYFSSTIVKATGAYAIVRGLNTTVSILKESTFSLEPAGIGVSLAAGQVLDPIDDMTERLSDVLVVSIVSLGIQKLFYEMSVTMIPQLLGVILFTLCLLTIVWSTKFLRLRDLLSRIALILLIGRLFLPLSTFANSYIQTYFFEQKITLATQELSITAKPLTELHEVSTPKEQGFWGKLKDNVQFVSNKTRQMKESLKEVMSKMESSIAHLLQLTLVYIGIFIFQVILMPLLFIWILGRLFSLPKLISAPALTITQF